MALLNIAIYTVLFQKLYTILRQRAQEARDNQFLFQNVQNNEIYEIFKMFKNNSWIKVYDRKNKRL